MTPEDEEFERIAQRQLAALKKATKATTEDAAVRAVHKVMAEYPDNFIDALKYDVAKRDSEAQQAYEDAFINGTGVMLGDKRIDPASIYKEPEQEPVAWMHTKIEGIAVPHRPADLDKHPDRWTALYPESKPCPTCEALARTVMMDQTAHDAQRKPLTDEEIILIVADCASSHQHTDIHFARAIEAAHGIKENK